MKLSTRGRYGLRMLIDLSLQSEKIVSLPSIAKRQEVSANYLELVAKDLRRAGYIRSVKGANGGYSLINEPKNIFIGDVLSLLEGDVRITDEYINKESILQECIRENVYDPLNKRLSELFYATTLDDIIKNSNS